MNDIDKNHPIPIFNIPLISDVDDVPIIAVGIDELIDIHLHGNPIIKDLNLGETQLSTMLTVANAKLAIIKNINEKQSNESSYLLNSTCCNKKEIFVKELGAMTTLTGDSEVSNCNHYTNIQTFHQFI